MLKVIGETSIGKASVKLADDVLEKLSSALNKVDSKVDEFLGITVKNVDNSATKVGTEVVEKVGKNTVTPTNEIKQNSVYPNFDYDHIIGGDVSKNGKRVIGGHSLTKGDVRILEIIDEPDINGVYNAKVEIFNQKTQKWEVKKANTTMFPEDWDDIKIKEEIKSAWNSKDFENKITSEGNVWSGTSSSGIKIRGYINKDRTTAFPEYRGDK